MTLTMQYLTVFAMSVSGAVLGAVYDVYRTILKEWKYLRWMGSILDFSYWIFALLWVLWSLHWANHVDMRLYIFLIMAIGLGLYRLLLRKAVVGSTVGMVMAVTWFLQAVWRIFLLTVVGPLLWLWRLLLALLRLIDRVARGIESILLWPFKPLLNTLEWLGRVLYRWTVQPLIEPVIKPVKKQIDAWMRPVRKFASQTKAKWKGFLRRVANWLTDSDSDENNQKRD